MDFRYPPEAEAFRKEFRAWLDANLPADARGRGLGGTLDGDRRRRLERLRAWNRTLADARYAAIAWPEEWGGRGAGVMEQVVYAEEMHRAHAPGTLNPLGLSNIAPAIIEHGTDEQKRDAPPPHAPRRRHLVPGILRAERRLRPRVAAHVGRARRRHAGS